MYHLVHFHVYSSVVLCVFMLCNQIPHLAKRKLTSRQHELFTSLSALHPWQPPFQAPSLWTALLRVAHMHDITQCVSFRDSLIPLNIMSSGFVHVVACDRIPSFLRAGWGKGMQIDPHFTVCGTHSSADGHAGGYWEQGCHEHSYATYGLHFTTITTQRAERWSPPKRPTGTSFEDGSHRLTSPTSSRDGGRKRNLLAK